MRFHLRSLLILLAVGPPVLAAGWWVAGDENRRSAALELVRQVPRILPSLAALVGFPVALAFLAAVLAGAITRQR